MSFRLNTFHSVVLAIPTAAAAFRNVVRWRSGVDFKAALMVSTFALGLPFRPFNLLLTALTAES